MNIGKSRILSFLCDHDVSYMRQIVAGFFYELTTLFLL